VKKLPWDETDDYIRSGHEDPGKFVDSSFRTIDVDADKGIKAVIGKLKGDPRGSTHVQSYLFVKSKGWNMDKAKAWFEKHNESVRFVQVKEQLVPFKFAALAAVPGKSLNNRMWTEDTLKQAAPLYKGKPFILDHDFASADKVIGVITDTKYDAGLRVEGVGLMQKDLFYKVAGTGKVPSLVKGVSISGQAEYGPSPNDNVPKNFQPEELSLTAFPGIPEAQLTEIELIRESIMGGEKTSLKETKKEDEVVIDVPLEEAEKQAAETEKFAPAQVTEADVPTSPDSKRIEPANMTQPPTLGGHQTGGYTEPKEPAKPTPPPPSEPQPVKTVQPQKQAVPEPKVVESKSVSLGPGEAVPFELTSRGDVVSRAQEILREMNGDARRAYLKIAREILEGQK
jgi:hypothetical protein